MQFFTIFASMAAMSSLGVSASPVAGPKVASVTAKTAAPVSTSSKASGTGAPKSAEEIQCLRWYKYCYYSQATGHWEPL